MNETPIQRICVEAVQALGTACDGDPVYADALHFLRTQDFTKEQLAPINGAVPAHHETLCNAIDLMPEGALKSALRAGHDHLHWRVDDGGFYAKGADVGQGYKQGNMHALLIGPQNAPILTEDFLLGFFLLTPRVLYRDHKHLAPEIYLPLTGPSGWRFNGGDWQDIQANTPIYNAPNVTHATRVYDTPFLALFIWSKDTQDACAVVPMDDWDAIEKRLD